MDCIGKLVPVYAVVQFCVHIDICEREDFVLNPFGDRESVQ